MAGFEGIYNSGEALGSASAWSGLGNKFTGNLDYQRDVALNQTNNAFNSAEAAKARDWEAEQAAIARAFNSAEAVKQRDFEKSLSDTQYSRAAADLKSLGLNPAMVLGGASASTPSGSSASIGTPSSSVAHSAGASRGAHGGSGWNSVFALLGTLAVAGASLARSSAMATKSAMATSKVAAASSLVNKTVGKTGLTASQLFDAVMKKRGIY